MLMKVARRVHHARRFKSFHRNNPMTPTRILSSSSTCQHCRYFTTTTKTKIEIEASTSFADQRGEGGRRTKFERLVETTNKLLATGVVDDTSSSSSSSSCWKIDDWKLAERSLYALTRQPKTTSVGINLSFQLLDRMVLEAEKKKKMEEGKNYNNNIITTQHINIVLDKWRIGSRFNLVGTRDAKTVLSMIDEYKSRLPTQQIVDTKTYSLIMAVAIKQNPKTSPIFCTNILNRMKPKVNNNNNHDHHHDTVMTPQPNSIVLTHLMDAHVKSHNNNNTTTTLSSSKATAESVLAIFDYMMANSKDDPLLEPTDKSLTRVLQAVLTSGMEPSEALPHMERILNYMLSLDGDTTRRKKQRVLPNSVFLNLALSFCDGKYRNNNNSSSNKTIRYTTDGKRVRLRSTAILADTLMTLVRNKSIEYPHIAPDGDAYSTIIQLLAKDGDFDKAPERADYWLQEMILLADKTSSKQHQQQHQHQQQYNKTMKKKIFDPPRASLYTSVIAAWERSDLTEAPHRGETVFQQMVESAPGNITAGSYYLLLSLWSKSNLPEAPEKAEELLRQMIDKSRKDSRLNPSCQAFVNVIMCWKRNANHCLLPETVAPAYRAQAVLDLLLEEHSKQQEQYSGKQQDLNEVPFNATINTWAASGLPEAEAKIDTILRRMEEVGKTFPAAAPSIVTAWSAMHCLSSMSKGASSKIFKLLNLMDNDNGKRNQHLRSRLYEKGLWILNQHHGGDDDESSNRSSAPLESERILRRYLREPYKNRNPRTTMACFGYVLDSWKKSSHPPEEVTKRSEELLKELEKEAAVLYKRSSNLDLYAFLAQAWAKSNHPNATKQVNEVLDRIAEKCKDQGRQLNHLWFSKVMQAFSEIGNAKHIQEFLKRVIHVYSHDFEASQIVEMHLVAIQTLVKNNEKEIAWEILQEIIDGDLTIKPSARCFGPIMLSYSQAGDYGMVESVWEKLQELYSSSNRDTDFVPDTTVLSALCHCEPRNAAREYSILYGLLERSRVDETFIPDKELVYSVLDSLVKSEDSSAGKCAEIILLKMQELYEEGLMAQPTFQAFQKVIDCWALSGTEGATERAERVLHFAESLSEDGDNHLKPTPQGYNSVIKAWSTSCIGEAPERIQRHIRKMQQRYEKGETNFQIDENIYSSLIEAYANSDRDDATFMAQAVFDNAPIQHKRTNLYNALIKAQGGDAIRAESILNQMHEEFSSGNDHTKPNTQTFNNLISSWSKSGSPMAAWRADNIFQRMEELSTSGKLDVKPDGNTFDIVISTLSNDWGADAARKVDRYLDLIKEHYRSGAKDCMPSAASYTEAIRAWGSNVDDPRAVLRAKALLDEMHELANEGAESVKPNLETYLVYLKALSQSEVEEKAELVKDVLSSMKNNGVEVDAALMSQIQKCSLPLGIIEASSWTLNNPIKDNELKSL